MNTYTVECYSCDDESTVIIGSDIPSFCPLCGSDDVVVVKEEEALEWYEDD